MASRARGIDRATYKQQARDRRILEAAHHLLFAAALDADFYCSDF